MRDAGISGQDAAPPVRSGTVRDILCFMQIPPDAQGHGGSQRAWFLAEAIARTGNMHFVLLYPGADEKIGKMDFAPLRAMAKSVTLIPIPEWSAASQIVRALPKRVGRYVDLLRMRSIFTPRFGRKTLSRIADQLPVRHVDTVFAGRMPTAVIADDMLATGEIACRRRLVDFDDIQSEFQRRSFRAEERRGQIDKWLINRLQLRMILRKEREIAERWDGIAICSDDDKALLTAKFPDAAIWKVPNVVDKPLLPQRSGAGYNILFVGNLSFGPNSHGLATFLAQAWPTVRDALPGARLKVVGMNPSADLHAKLRAADAELHANVPSVTPYYADCDIVIAPIFFGSGTRIKILEAMAFGRPVLSTSLGAEGLGVQDGVHAAIADSMPDFATALIDLADNPEKRTALAEAGRCLQQEYFGPMSMIRAVNNMTDTCS